MIDAETERFGKWLAVDDDGKAWVFLDRPERSMGTWIPSKFRSAFGPACVPAGRLPGMEGLLMTKRGRGGNTRWEIA